MSKVPKLDMLDHERVPDSKKRKGGLDESSSGWLGPALTDPAFENTTRWFFEEGRDLAKSTKNKTLLAYAKNVEKAINKRQFGIPLYYSNWYVEGHDKCSYDIRFSADKSTPAEIFVGSYPIARDLDLYVYDQNWNLIAKDTSSDGHYILGTWVHFFPRQDGNFRIVIVNNSNDTVSFELYHTK